MATLKIKDSRRVKIRAVLNKTRVRLRFGIDDASQYKSIEFELDAILALALSEEIRKLLPSGNAPVPPSRAPSGAGPKLRIVK